MRSAARLLATIVAWAAVGACAGALGVLLAPLVHGGRPLVVLSDSMAPALRTGDAVLVDRIAPHRARLGDVVTFRRPRGGGELISHRVIGVRPERGRVSFITRGDANSEPERWSVPSDASIGRIQHVLPKLGAIAIATDNPPLRAALMVIAALVVAGLSLLRIWGPRAAPAHETGDRTPAPAASPDPAVSSLAPAVSSPAPAVPSFAVHVSLGAAPAPTVADEALYAPAGAVD